MIPDWVSFLTTPIYLGLKAIVVVVDSKNIVVVVDSKNIVVD
jgi:hypothetical protein